LYFHGGGYAFYPAVSQHFIRLLAHRLQTTIFALDYRLTPEHPHPAQQDDAVQAYRYLLAQGLRPQDIVLGGDSAGGHLALMTLVRVRQAGLPQPALALALSPWTDTGRRGASQFGHDRYDMVQGYQTLRYGQWLKGEGPWSDAQLSLP
jgi:monoterpene epsilon-lactone hydrolase